MVYSLIVLFVHVCFFSTQSDGNGYCWPTVILPLGGNLRFDENKQWETSGLIGEGASGACYIASITANNASNHILCVKKVVSLVLILNSAAKRLTASMYHCHLGLFKHIVLSYTLIHGKWRQFAVACTWGPLAIALRSVLNYFFAVVE